MADNENTTPAGVIEVATELNDILAKFIKGNGKAVRYFRTEDGYSFITLNYGKSRVPEMEKIKEFINNSVYDDCLKIDNMPVTCVRVSDSIMVFKGKTEEVETYISQNASKEVLTNIVARAKVASTEEKEQILSLDDDIASILESLVSERSTFSSDALKKAGVTFDEYDGVGHINFDIKKINDYVALGETAKDYEQIFDVYTLITKLTFYKANFARDFDKFIQNSSFDSELKAKITLLTDSKLIIGYGITKYDEMKKVDDFSYTKTPGYLSKIIVHYDVTGKSAVSANDLVFKKYHFNNDYATEYEFDALFVEDKDGAFYAASIIDPEYENSGYYNNIFKTEEQAKTFWISQFTKVKAKSKVILNVYNSSYDEGTDDYLKGYSTANDDYPIQDICKSMEANSKLKQFLYSFILSRNGSALGMTPSLENLTAERISSLFFGNGEYNQHHVIGDSNGVVYKNFYHRAIFPNCSMCGFVEYPDYIDAESVSEIFKHNSEIYSSEVSRMTYSAISSAKNIIYAALESGRAIDIYIDDSSEY